MFCVMYLANYNIGIKLASSGSLILEGLVPELSLNLIVVLTVLSSSNNIENHIVFLVLMKDTFNN